MHVIYIKYDVYVYFSIYLILVQPGRNTIEQKSTKSAVTIPFERTFRNLDENRPTGGDNLERFDFCGCGWPQHMLIPKGNKEGFAMELFVMVSDYKDDRVCILCYINIILDFLKTLVLIFYIAQYIGCTG